MVAKNEDNTQFARIADALGNSPIGPLPIGDGVAPLADDNGRLIVRDSGLAPVQASMIVGVATAPPLVNFQMTVGPTRVFQIWASHNNVATQWLQMFDSAAPPAALAVPLYATLPIPQAGVGSLVVPTGLLMLAGFNIGFSSTPDTWTAGGPGLITAIARQP